MPGSQRRDALAVFLIAATIYIALGGYTFQSIDTLAASEPARVFASTGSLNLDGHSSAANPWFFETPDGTFSNRYPGVIAYSVPFYLLAQAFDQTSPVIPGVVAAAVATAAACGLMVILLGRLGLGRSTALGGALFFAFGSATFSVSADAQWAHSATQLLIVAGLLTLTYRRDLAAGLILGLLIPVRPQLAPAVLVLGLTSFPRRDQLRHLVRFGLAASVGPLLLISYNAAVFSRWSVDNGLTGYYGFGVDNLARLPGNLVGTLVDPTRGILFLYPALILVALGLRPAWGASPPWVRAGALSGIAAVATQLALNRYSGGDAFFGSRLTIEGLTLAYPLFVMSWTFVSDGLRRIGVALLAISVVLHVAGGVSYPHVASGAIALPLAYTGAAVVGLIGVLLVSRGLTRIAATEAALTNRPRDGVGE